MSILIVAVMYGVIGYLLLLTKQYYGITILIIIVFLMFNRRINLYDDKIEVYQLYKKVNIRFDLIQSIKIADYKVRFSNATLPSLYLTLKDGKEKVVHHSSYAKESIIEIIEHILKYDNSIKVDSNVKALIGNEESEYDLKIKKDNKQTVNAMMVGLIVGIIYFLLQPDKTYEIYKIKLTQ